MSSFAMAASKRGAPVKVCNAAPKVERTIPRYIIAGRGQATSAVRSLHRSSKSWTQTKKYNIASNFKSRCCQKIKSQSQWTRNQLLLISGNSFLLVYSNVFVNRLHQTYAERTFWNCLLKLERIPQILTLKAQRTIWSMYRKKSNARIHL